jgi:hypothetical protein
MGKGKQAWMLTKMVISTLIQKRNKSQGDIKSGANPGKKACKQHRKMRPNPAGQQKSLKICIKMVWILIYNTVVYPIQKKCILWLFLA